ncbi:glutaminase A [Halanaerobiaceae bacterium Z-7014]|uniref:Glutaminase n=1 Tax=Halonatronomonas betaini TaxID=2778430 RepID=A0A931FAI3_9FIRM|nr:glutaminase A [Halonatronomonas betaini]MBF8437624.1 glutaminase A [Halonatronomonas betaini]
MDKNNCNILLKNILESNLKNYQKGKVASYIPALNKVEPNLAAVVMVDMTGEVYKAGDWNYKFTIQSISKPIVLALAILELGEEAVFKRVGVEPTGEEFNSINKLVGHPKPFNPMINAGAIAVTSLIRENKSENSFNILLKFFKNLFGNKDLKVDEEVYKSEKMTADRNRSLAYFLKDHRIIKGDVEKSLDLYFKQCSIKVDTVDIARASSVFANRGIDPITGDRIISKKVASIVRSIMLTCGMYDRSGSFAIDVGIPAKSGVSGGILAPVKNRFGIGVFGPSLDNSGNSVVGMNVLKSLSEELNLHML